MTDYIVNFSANTHGVDFETVFRDDGVDVAVSEITIGAGLTGQFINNGFSALMASGSLVCNHVDTNDAGAITLRAFLSRFTT